MKEMQNKIKEYFKELQFDAQKHSYEVRGKPLTSVSKTISKYVEKVDFGGALASVTDSSCSLTATFKSTGVYPGLSGKTIIVAMTIQSTGASQWEVRQS